MSVECCLGKTVQMKTLIIDSIMASPAQRQMKLLKVLRNNTIITILLLAQTLPFILMFIISSEKMYMNITKQ